MAIATATYTINEIDHLLRRNHKSGATYVSRARVTVTCGADDTYVTDGVTISAASCGLNNIKYIRVLGAVTDANVALIGAMYDFATAKLVLYSATNGAEISNGTDITGYVFLLEVEGYV